MPAVDVCLWNIQNYGQNSGKYNGTGANNALRNRFIAAFVVEHQIDVLMIMEMQPGMQAALADLVTKLNAAYPAGQKDWAYSYCGCAIVDDTVDVVAGPADLIDRTGARSECYAVIWRYNRLNFTMIEAVAQIGQATTAGQTSPLNISQRGRPTGNNNFTFVGPATFGATGGFVRTQVHPYEYNYFLGYQLMASWPKLNYPLTSNLDGLRPSWAKSRRPAYVVIQLNDAAQTLCPVVAYHAPSNQQRASWGAFMAGLARELYVVDGVDGALHPTPAAAPVLADYGFVGGDFNYSVDEDDWPDDYGYFVDARGTNYGAGAFQQAVPAHDEPAADRRTTVQIITGQNHDEPIVKPDTDDYLRYKIDLGFHRQINEITAQRIDLLTEVIANPNNAYDTALTQTAAYMNTVVAGLAGANQRMTVTGPQQRKRQRDGSFVWSSMITGSWGSTFTNWNAARNQYAAHNILTARRAAEYVHIFVSDHLPLIATFTF